MLKKFLLLLGLFALTGCATTQNYQRIVNNWQGATMQELMDSWGYPDGAVKLPNGNTVYMYTRQQLYSSPDFAQPTPGVVFNAAGRPIYTPGFYTGVPGRTISLYCRTWFEANPKGVIVNTRFQGNNCVSASGGGTKPS